MKNDSFCMTGNSKMENMAMPDEHSPAIERYAPSASILVPIIYNGDKEALTETLSKIGPAFIRIKNVCLNPPITTSYYVHYSYTSDIAYKLSGSTTLNLHEYRTYKSLGKLIKKTNPQGPTEGTHTLAEDETFRDSAEQ